MNRRDWSNVSRMVAATSLVFMFALGGRATAGTEIISDQPAASLLLPYFEVNLDDRSAATTMLSINDASATAIQKIRVGAGAIPTSFDAGWMYLDLNSPTAGTFPTGDPTAEQAWVSTIYDNSTYRVGERATLLDSAVSANHIVPQ
jgi:hypothetical protein